jgi:hypothetical protein
MKMKNKDEKQPPAEGVTKAQLLELLNQGKTMEVLQICEPIGLMYVLLQQQLTNLEKDFEMGLVDYSNMEVIRNRIKFAVRNSIERLPDGPIDFQYWKAQNIYSFNKTESSLTSRIGNFLKQLWKKILG